MAHSSFVSEPAALLSGLLAGFAGYALAHLAGADPALEMSVATACSVLANVAVGAPINLVALDFLTLLVARPLSPILGAKILQALIA